MKSSDHDKRERPSSPRYNPYSSSYGRLSGRRGHGGGHRDKRHDDMAEHSRHDGIDHAPRHDDNAGPSKHDQAHHYNRSYDSHRPYPERVSYSDIYENDH